MSLSFIFVTTWRSILSEIDLVVLPLAISFIIRTFSLSARSFSRPLFSGGARGGGGKGGQMPPPKLFSAPPFCPPSS